MAIAVVFTVLVLLGVATTQRPRADDTSPVKINTVINRSVQ